MKRGLRVLSLLLIWGMLFSNVISVEATTVKEAQEKADQLEEDKEKAEAQKQELTSKLNTLIAEMEATQEELTKKQQEIDVAEEELIEAQIEENNQYESMKKRIRFMYEVGNTDYIEVIVSAESMSDLLNKVEYVEQISSYDRQKLEEFQEIVQFVEEKKAQLEQEYNELEVLQTSLEGKKAEVESLLKATNTEISNLESAIGENAENLKKLIAAAEEAARIKAEREAANSANNGSSGGSAGGSVVTGNGTLTHPMPGYSRISSYFGYREQPLAGASTNHKGVDFAGPTGTPLYAAAAGTVVTATYSGNAGNLIVINHGNGMVTKYMHCQSLYVTAGMKVSKGQNIGTCGNTGNSTGPHLHFQLEINGTPVNPLNYL